MDIKGVFKMKRFILGIFIFLIAIFTVACGKDETKDNNIQLTEKEKLPDDQVVVIVNDVELTGAIYNSMYLQLKTIATKPDEEVDVERLRDATIDSIVDKELFMQLAKKDGIEIDENEVEDQLENFKKLDRDGYDTLMEQFNYTEEAIASQLKLELARKEYIEKNIKVEVSEEEVEQLYNEVKERTEEIPDFDSVREELRSTIEVQKSVEEVGKHVDEFKKEAEIQVLL